MKSPNTNSILYKTKSEKLTLKSSNYAGHYVLLTKKERRKSCEEYKMNTKCSNKRAKLSEKS